MSYQDRREDIQCPSARAMIEYLQCELSSWLESVDIHGSNGDHSGEIKALMGVQITARHLGAMIERRDGEPK